MENAKAHLIELIEDKGYTQTQIARAIGKSVAVVNQFIKGTYTGDVKKIAELVNEFIERLAEKAKNKQLVAEFIPTYTAKKGLEVVRVAHLESEVNVIYGEAGLGKSMILKEYSKRNQNAILIEADPGYTPKALLEDLLKILGTNKSGSIHDMSNACIEALRGTERVILVDEAELLPYRALEVLRRIHDKAGVGVVLAGMPRLIINLKGKRGEYAQLYSRIGFAFNLGSTLSKEELQEIAINYLDAARDESISDSLFNACKGNARRLFKLLKGIKRMSNINDAPVTPTMIKSYADMLIN